MRDDRSIPIRPDHPKPAQFEPQMETKPLPHDVAMAIAFMRKNMGQLIRPVDLTQAAATPERTLHKHFLRFVGIAPFAFLRRLRLAAAREALLSTTDSVTEIATKYGVGHFGRFSADYRRYFGELPSATRRRRTRPGPPPLMDTGAPNISVAAQTVVIAPFRTLGDRESNHLADALREQIAAELARVPGISVRLARLEARRHEAAYSLAGSVTRASGRVRVVVKLVDASEECHLWGDSFDAYSGEELALLDGAVSCIAREVPSRIFGQQIEQAQRAEPSALGATAIALRALPLALTPQFEQAFQLTLQAMAIAPDCALAAALAGWCHARRVKDWSVTACEERVAATRLANQAAMLAPADPMVLAIRASVAHLAREFADAEALARRAVALDPSCAWGWDRLGWLYEATNRPGEAMRFFARAERINAPYLDAAAPLDGLGTAHFSTGHYAEAALVLRAATLLRPGSTGLHGKLAACYLQIGEKAMARLELTTLRRIVPGMTATQYANGFPCGFDEFRNRLANSLIEIGMPA